MKCEGQIMPFYPQLQTQLEIAVSTQLKAAPGHMLKFLVHTRATDKTKVWRVWDSASGPVSGDPGNIVGAWFADDPKEPWLGGRGRLAL